MAPNSHYTHLRKRRKKGPRKVFDEIIAGNFPNMGKETVNQVQEAQSPLQDKHIETHINKANTD